MNLLNSVKTYLLQPEEADFSFKEGLPSTVGISVTISFLVYYFYLRHIPFPFIQQLIYSICFGLITLGVSLANDLLFPKIFQNWFDEKNWTLGKQICYIIWNFVSIAVANVTFMVFMGWISLSANSFIQILLATFIVGVFPVTVLGLLEHNRKLKKRLKEAIQINEHLHQPKAPPKTTQNIRLSSNQQNISTPISNFLFASSERNYLRIVLQGKEDLMIRNTIKNLEATLESHPTLVRCHRAYIVNTEKVISVSGNAQGYRLKLEGCEEEVPVSRSYIPAVQQLIG